MCGNTNRMLIIRILIITILVLMMTKIDFFKEERKFIKVETLNKNSGSCYIQNCAKYSCQTDECCTCAKCVEGTFCYECPPDYTLDHTSNRCWKKSPTQSKPDNGKTTNNDDMEKDKCYIKRGNGVDNEYCFGKLSTCVGFSEELSGVTLANCNEKSVCYKSLLENKYVIGKYNNQQGYEYIGESCPSYACYQKNNGEYYWTNMPLQNEIRLNEITIQSDCITPNKDNNMFIFVIIAVAIVIIVILAILKSKDNNNNYNNMRNYFN